MTPQDTNAPAVDQQRLVGPESQFREFDPKSELPRYLDEYKWHRDDSQWSQTGRDATPADVAAPHYPKVWRTKRPNAERSGPAAQDSAT